jgi:hypothetical protein
MDAVLRQKREIFFNAALGGCGRGTLRSVQRKGFVPQDGLKRSVVGDILLGLLLNLRLPQHFVVPEDFLGDERVNQRGWILFALKAGVVT